MGLAIRFSVTEFEQKSAHRSNRTASRFVCESAKTVHELIEQESLNPVDDKSEPIVNRAEIPLSSGMKTFALIIPIFTCAGFALYALAKNGYVRQGCDRKARELGTWFVAGIVVWFLLIAILTTRAR